MKLFILLLSLYTLASICSGEDAVVDITGKKLRRGDQYYILPVFRGRGGGLTLAGRNHSCPLAVVQELSEVKDGLPVSFSPVNDSDNTVKLSTDVNVAFKAVTTCVQSTVWRLGGVESGNRRYVVTGGLRGRPGLSTVSNWFRVETSGDSGRDYKLVFCPHVCDYCKVLCGDLGVFVEGTGKRWLGFGGDYFPVMFKKLEPSGQV
ncbi:hypothetical protein J5N97_001915 [Dioscorea zingiberensis]|uniref:Uncharacterized protein n=1 Tax=Dioscorea zingiberensis TaxID=325984 RepID=A0A9D5BT01_9LILI|nr:hypothetical protein J5N97_001915 [Dioscorea zingiberensis]